MNETGHLLVLHGLVVGLLSAWQLTDCLSCNFFLEGLLCHPCQEKVSLCTLKSECVIPLFFFVAQGPLRRDSLFSLPIIVVFCFVFLFRPEQVSWREGGDGGGTGGGGERHWVGQIIMGTEKRTGTKGCDFSQDSPSVTFRSLPLLFHGQSHK